MYTVTLTVYDTTGICGPIINSQVINVTDIYDHFTYENVIIYPNPTRSNIYIRFKDNLSEDLYVKVFDMKGNLIFSNKFLKTEGKEVSIDMHRLIDGIYMVHIYNSEMNIIKRIIKN